MGAVLWWVAALLCCQGCCKKVCGRCEGSVWKECSLCCPQEALQNRCRWLLSPPCTGGMLSDWNTALRSLHSTGRDVLIPGETPHWSSYCCCCHLEGTTWCPGERKRHWAGHGLAPYTTVCLDLCSSSVIHSFSHQLKIPVV